MRPTLRGLWLLLVIIAAGCPATTGRPGSPVSPTILFSERFDVASQIASDWRAGLPAERPVVVRMGDGEAGSGLSIVLPASESSGVVSVRRWLGAEHARGDRVRLSARVRVADGAVARVALGVQRGGQTMSYDDRAESSAHTSGAWGSVYAIVDVAQDATGLELEVIASGTGEVSIDNVMVERLEGTSRATVEGRALSAAELDRVTTLTRSIGLIRYFHPSDQSAELDWDRFIVAAIERVLSVESQDALLESLRAMFRDVAPTADFYRDGDTPPARTWTVAGGSVLTRWHHFGLGTAGPFVSFRSDVGVEPRTELVAYRRMPARRLERCRTIRARTTTDDVHGEPDAWLEVRVLRGGMHEDVSRQPLGTARGADSVVEQALPTDARRVDVGLGISGHGSIRITDLVVQCDGEAVTLARGPDAWTEEGKGRALYELRESECETSRCLELSRAPAATTFDASRDVLDVAIGSGLRVRLPLAVWTDGQRTLPLGDGGQPEPVAAIRDRGTRLGAVAAAWVTLEHFYPYFDDLGVDWAGVLPVALQEAAKASSTVEVHGVLKRMIAALEDDHARVMHAAAPIDGILPVSMRHLDGVLVATGGLPEYRDVVPVGSEILEIEGVPAAEVFRRHALEVSASTEAWRAYSAAFYLTVGPIGELVGLRVRRDGVEQDVVMPRVSRDGFGTAVAEPRPSSGSELSPGVFYVNLETLDARQWEDLMPALKSGKSVIFDLRGYLTNTAFDVVSHFIDAEVLSPRFETPIVGPAATAEYGYQRAQWSLQPSSPRLTARALFLVDGRSASAAETLLQIVRESSIATIIGEPTGGTNGNTNRFEVPGGFTVRFTGMRALFADGTTIQGRGITPDVIVHPTLAGIEAGRDEVLEAALSMASATTE